jgi:hypothetical protein
MLTKTVGFFWTLRVKRHKGTGFASQTLYNKNIYMEMFLLWSVCGAKKEKTVRYIILHSGLISLLRFMSPLIWRFSAILDRNTGAGLFIFEHSLALKVHSGRTSQNKKQKKREPKGERQHTVFWRRSSTIPNMSAKRVVWRLLMNPSAHETRRANR